MKLGGWKSMYRLVFQSFANNEIRIGWDETPYPRKTGGDLTAQRSSEQMSRRAETSREQYLRDNKYLEYRDKDGTLYQGNAREGYRSPLRDSPLDIPSEVQECGKKYSSCRGGDPFSPVRPTRFGNNARHRILEAGALCEIDRKSGARGVFVTFTLPASTWESYVALSQWSGWLCNRVLQVLRDYKWSETWFYVWELQKRGALHLHLFIQVPRGESTSRMEHPLKAAWYSGLEAISDRAAVDMFRSCRGEYCTSSQYWQFNYQEVHTGVANYISKYVSKGTSKDVARNADGGTQGLCPRRWWGMSRSLTRRVTAHRKTVCVDGLTRKDCMDAMNSIKALLHGCNPVLTHEYTAIIGRSPRCPDGFGLSHRHIAWFKPEEIEEVEVVARTLMLCVSEQLPRKGRIITKGFARSYKGEALDIVSATIYNDG